MEGIRKMRNAECGMKVVRSNVVRSSEKKSKISAIRLVAHEELGIKNENVGAALRGRPKHAQPLSLSIHKFVNEFINSGLSAE